MFGFISVSLFTFVIYFFGISHSVFGGDSGDIILASWFGGVAHPPGYPLNTMIGWVFTHLPYSATVAYKANLMAAVLQAIAIGILFLILKQLTKNAIVSLAAALTLAFNPLFWLYAHVAEVFQLTLILSGLTFYFLLLWRESVLKKRPLVKLLYFAVFLYGLAVFHHQTTLLLLPGLVYLALATDKKGFVKVQTLVKLSLFFLAGFLPYLFSISAAFRDTPINWDDPTNIPNLIRLLTRADYGSFVSSNSFLGVTAKDRIFQVFSYFSFVKADFSILGIALIAIGGARLFLNDRNIFWSLCLIVLFSGPFFVSYSSFALANEFLFSVWERFILLSYYFWAIFLAFGFLSIFKFISAKLRDLKFNLSNQKISGKVFDMILLFSFLFLPLSFLFVNWTKADLSEYKIGDQLGRDVLALTEPNSIVFLFDDTVAFNTQYIYYTTDDFRDRTVFLGGLMRHLYYRKQVVERHQDLNIPVEFLEDKDAQSGDFIKILINANLGKFSIFSIDYNPEIAGHVWVPWGLLERLVNEKSVKDEEMLEGIEDAFLRLELKDFPKSYSHFVHEHIRSIYARGHIQAGHLFFEEGLYDEALEHFKKSETYFPNSKLAPKGQADSLLKLNRCNEAKVAFNKLYAKDRNDVFVLDKLSQIARECDKDENAAEMFRKMAEEEKQKREPSFKQF